MTDKKPQLPPITKAIIPVAGRGTRRLPITKAIEKSMLPIGNRPLVDFVVQDCIKAGITDIYFVISEGSTQIKKYYDRDSDLDNYLLDAGKSELLKYIAPNPSVRMHYITQPNEGKYGTAVPVSLVVDQIPKQESVLVMTGDDFIFNPDGSSEAARLMEMTPEGGNSMLSVTVAPDRVSNYGVIHANENKEFIQIVEKPDPEFAPSNQINVSKYVLNPDMLASIKNFMSVEISGEYGIIEVMNQYAFAGGSIKVIPAGGQYLDGGTVEGWLRANNVVLKMQ